jgi:hypothetical protein
MRIATGQEYTHGFQKRESQLVGIPQALIYNYKMDVDVARNMIAKGMNKFRYLDPVCTSALAWQHPLPPSLPFISIPCAAAGVRVQNTRMWPQIPAQPVPHRRGMPAG